MYTLCAMTFVTQLYHYISSAVLTHECISVFVRVYTCMNFHYVSIIFITQLYHYIPSAVLTHEYMHVCVRSHAFMYHHSIYACIYVPPTCMYNEDCFYYHSWRNNVVIAFATLSFFLTCLHIVSGVVCIVYPFAGDENVKNSCRYICTHVLMYHLYVCIHSRKHTDTQTCKHTNTNTHTHLQLATRNMQQAICNTHTQMIPIMELTNLLLYENTRPCTRTSMGNLFPR